MRLAIAVLTATLGLAACGSNCKKACENIAAVCAEEFTAQGKTFDVAHCTDSCQNNLDGCKNMDQQESCTAEAKTCRDLDKCPACLQ